MYFQEFFGEYVCLCFDTGIIMEKIRIGKIVNVVGLKGEVKVYNYSDSSEIYETTDEVYVGDRLCRVEAVRLQKNVVILKLMGVDDRDSAERLRGTFISVTEDDLPELPDGQFYVRDLIGMTAVEENGNVLGHVTDVLQNTAQDIFEIEDDNGKKILIPKVDQFVLNIDSSKREITVRMIEGLRDL